ncbi:MAG: mechanosensitive ion channel family protein [Deltaproteobacteria bacterium]|nr:mechanosensitive ion channel family protein [Deltaproteobacteria bacterium]
MDEHISALFLNRRAWIELIVERALKVAVIIAIVFICAKLIRMLSRRILDVAQKRHDPRDKHAHEREKRLATLVKLVDTTMRVALFGIAILMVLRECGLDITPFLTGAGIAGVAVGFGAQSLVKDVISGFFLLMEDQIRVGDVIKINSGLSGSVERMELRVTAIRDGDGTLHVIPNGEIKSVSNMTYEFATAVVDIPLGYATDIKKAGEVLTKVAQELENDPKWKEELRTRPEFIGIVGFATDHMMLELVAKTEPHSRWAVARELRVRSKLALDAAGVEMPKGFTVHLEQA